MDNNQNSVYVVYIKVKDDCIDKYNNISIFNNKQKCYFLLPKEYKAKDNSSIIDAFINYNKHKIIDASPVFKWSLKRINLIEPHREDFEVERLSNNNENDQLLIKHFESEIAAGKRKFFDAF